MLALDRPHGTIELLQISRRVPTGQDDTDRSSQLTVRFRGRPGRALALIALLAVVVGLRWIALGDRPLHHDEGVNAWLTDQLLGEGTYRYDPGNYHGPPLFYLHAPFAWLEGWLAPAEPVPVELRGEAWVRSSSALWGTLLLLAVGLAPGVPFRERLVGLLLAGASCTLLYYSRYLIHEPLLVLLTVALLLSLRGAERAGWPLPAALTGVAAATKETFGLTIAAMACGWLLAETAGRRGRRLVPLRLRCSWPPSSVARRTLSGAWATAFLAWAVSISSCGTHPRGVLDGLRALAPWLNEAVETAHAKPATYYLEQLLTPYDTAVLVSALFALGLAVWRRHRVGLFFAGWAVVLLAAYSIIPYKTPWLLLQPLLPMILAGGWAGGLAVACARQWGGRRAANWSLGAVLLVLFILGRPVQTATVVFREATLERHPQAYVHTDMEVLALLAVLRTVDRERGNEAPIEVLAPDYWPLPWYLRHRTGVRFWGELRPIEPDAGGVLSSPAQRDELSPRVPGWTRRSFRLRPGAELDLYLRPEPADEGAP